MLCQKSQDLLGLVDFAQHFTFMAHENSSLHPNLPRIGVRRISRTLTLHRRQRLMTARPGVWPTQPAKESISALTVAACGAVPLPHPQALRDLHVSAMSPLWA